MVDSNNLHVLYDDVQVQGTDTIVDKREYSLEVPLPYFEISGIRYNFEEGQTVSQWVSSAFNTDNFSIDQSGYLVNSNNETLINPYSSNYIPVQGTDTLSDGMVLIKNGDTVQFSISGQSYNTLYSETWETWINSDRNTGGYSIVGSSPYNKKVTDQNGNYIVDASIQEGGYIMASNYISPADQYGLDTESYSFKVNGVSYTCQYLVYWGDWINSVNNTGGFTIDNNNEYILDAQGRRLTETSNGVTSDVTRLKFVCAKEYGTRVIE